VKILGLFFLAEEGLLRVLVLSHGYTVAEPAAKITANTSHGGGWKRIGR